jgi:hypothetical protein
MPGRIAFSIVLAALGLAGCGSTDAREWMKVDQRYTKEDFKRDYRECSRSGDLNDTCMRQRGWVAVNPSKSETPPPEPTTPRGRRY